MIILDWVKICDIICHKRDVTLPARNRELPTPIISLEDVQEDDAGGLTQEWCGTVLY